VRHVAKGFAQSGRPLRLMFQDEARFGRITIPRRCWAPKGCRPVVPCQLVREYTFVYAAVSPHDGAMVSLILPEVRTPFMSYFLTEISTRYDRENILLVMDRAGWHIAKGLTIPQNIRLIWLPPYSPECNPVEHLWDEIREKWFANRLFNSLDAVEDTLVSALLHLENHPSKVKLQCAFPWIVNIPLIAT
jgi:transposase